MIFAESNTAMVEDFLSSGTVRDRSLPHGAAPSIQDDHDGQDD
jgi:hypothetical protein